MYHKLDIHPVPEEVLYINELSLAENVPYETKQDMEKAVTGKCVRDSGILPDDNVRIYVPMDLNADIIMWQLYSLFGSLGYPSESNESVYSSAVYIPTGEHHLHGLLEPVSRKVRTTFTETEPN